jgi:hypothetical protein
LKGCSCVFALCCLDLRLERKSLLTANVDNGKFSVSGRKMQQGRCRLCCKYLELEVNSNVEATRNFYGGRFQRSCVCSRRLVAFWYIHITFTPPLPTQRRTMIGITATTDSIQTNNRESTYCYTSQTPSTDRPSLTIQPPPAKHRALPIAAVICLLLCPFTFYTASTTAYL